MAVKSNKLLPVAGGAVVLLIVAIFMQSGAKQDGAAPMEQVPLPTTVGADQDTPDETLATVVQTNRELRQDVQEVLRINQELREKLGSGGKPSSNVDVVDVGGHQPAAPSADQPGLTDVFNSAFSTFSSLNPQSRTHNPDAQHQEQLPQASGVVGYKVLPPMGYVKHTERNGNQEVTQYVRRTGAAPVEGTGRGAATQAAAAAAQAPQPPAVEAYFTLPENATLAGVTTMTSLIGRVPVNGRVTDPMQFKALIGRDNLAANGWELPEDLAGMVVTGVAIGDMALSCTEGKVRSMTFVFNDGAIRTVSNRRSGSSNSAGAAGGDLGFISDLHGNPCIQGTFVTNAPRYLADIVGIKGLGIAAEALAQAQTTVTSSGEYSQSTVTGNAGNYAMGRMGAAATEELAKWLTERLKSSFDAVVTPSGQQVVVHLDQEIHIDKPASPRKLVHRTQTPNVLSGARYGLQ